jgi:hypothetical protein
MSVVRRSQDVLQRSTFDKLHDQIGLALFVFFDVVNGHDARMRHAAGQLRLPEKASLVVGQLVRVEAGGENNLDGDNSADKRVVRFVHYAHRAAPQFLNDFVPPDTHGNRIYRRDMRNTNPCS